MSLTLYPTALGGQKDMSSRFVSAMTKLSTLGQEMSNLVDCSDVIPGYHRPV